MEAASCLRSVETSHLLGTLFEDLRDGPRALRQQGRERRLGRVYHLVKFARENETDGKQ
jgi:hypothetical protein